MAIKMLLIFNILCKFYLPNLRKAQKRIGKTKTIFYHTYQTNLDKFFDFVSRDLVQYQIALINYTFIVRQQKPN